MTNTLLTHSQHIREVERAAATSTATATSYIPIASGPTSMTTLYPDTPFSYTPGETSVFISTLPSENPLEEPTSVTDSGPSESNRA